VIAILVTFAVLYGGIKLFVPQQKLDNLAQTFAPASTPERAFAERLSGIELEVLGIVEEVLADTLEGHTDPPSVVHQRFRFRSFSGHPMAVLCEIPAQGRLALSVGDTLSLRGEYRWDTRGGTLLASGVDPDREGL
jgi:hypothetical protein